MNIEEYLFDKPSMGLYILLKCFQMIHVEGIYVVVVPSVLYLVRTTVNKVFFLRCLNQSAIVIFC